MNTYNLYILAFEVTRITAPGVSEVNSIMELKYCEARETQYVVESDNDRQDEGARNRFWPNQIWKGEAFVTEEEYEWYRDQITPSMTFTIPDDSCDEMWFETASKLGIPGDLDGRSIYSSFFNRISPSLASCQIGHEWHQVFVRRPHRVTELARAEVA